MPLDLPLNTWVQQSPTVQFYGTFGAQGGRIELQGWNRFAYAKPTQRCYVFEVYRQNAPSDYANENIYANALWEYDPVTDTLKLLKVFNWKRNLTAAGDPNDNTVPLPANASDPTPVPRHTYGQVFTFFRNGLPYLGILGGANVTAQAGNTPDDQATQAFWFADLARLAYEPGAAGVWTQVDISGHPDYNDFTDMNEMTGEVDPVDNKYYWFGAKGAGSSQKRQTGILNLNTLELETPIDQGGETAGQGDPEIDQFGMGSCTDTTRRCAYFLGGEVGGSHVNTLHKFDFATRVWSIISYTGTLTGRKWPKITYDRRRDRVYIFGGVATGGALLQDLYEFDPNTNTVTALSPSGGPPQGAGTTLTLIYDDHADCLVYYTAADPLTPAIWLYRPTATPGPALPAAPLLNSGLVGRPVPIAGRMVR